MKKNALSLRNLRQGNQTASSHYKNTNCQTILLSNLSVPPCSASPFTDLSARNNIPNAKSLVMGRGKNWGIDENALIACAGLYASEEPIVGADQGSKKFLETMRRRFIEKGPSETDVCEGKDGFRTMESCRKHFEELSTDPQKFARELRKVHVSNPTGVNQEGILSMVVAVHLGNKNKMY